jgi:hypothetical protein
MGNTNLPMTGDWNSTLRQWKRVLEHYLNGNVNSNTSVAGSKVTISDAAGNFAGSNAESVLAELGGRWVLSSTGLPTASSSYTRKIIYLSNGAGVADKVYVCYKQADDTYAWAAIV